MADDTKVDPKEQAELEVKAKNAIDAKKKSQEEYIKLLTDSNNLEELSQKMRARGLAIEKEIVKNKVELHASSIRDVEQVNKRVQATQRLAEVEAEKYTKAKEDHESEMEAFNEKYGERLKRLNEQIETLETIKDLGDDLSKAQEKNLEKMKTRAKRLEDFKKNQELILDVQREVTQRTHDQAKATAEVDEYTNSWANRLTGVSTNQFNNSIFGSINGLGGFSAALSQVGSSLKTIFNPLNVATSVLQKIGESTMMMVLATDQAQASFYKATGASEDYGATIRTVREEAASFGVNIDEAGAAVTELFQSMSQFTELTKEAQVEVASFSATMAELGVDNSITAKTLDVLTRGLGKSTDEAMRMSREITASAQAIGISVGKMHADFNEALPTLAKYGDDAMEVFKGLAAASKLAGLETGRLLDIAAQFDTFDSAAESVGRLNGILGGNYLNSLEMVNLSEEERIRKLIESVQASGRAFNTLGKFEQQAIASAVGITNMAEANKLFGLSLEAYDDLQAKANAGAMSQEEMAEQANKARTATEKLQNFMQSLAIAVSPLVSIMNVFMDILLGIQKIMGPLFAPALALVAGAFLFMKIKIMQTNAAIALHIKMQKIDTIATQLGTGASTSAIWAERQRIAVKLGLASAMRVGTITEGQDTISKGANTAMTLKQIWAGDMKLTKKLGLIKANIAETISENASTIAKKAGTMADWGAFGAKLKNVGATILRTASTIALTAAESALTVVVYAGAAAWAVLKFVWAGVVAVATWLGTSLGLVTAGAAGVGPAAFPAAAGIVAIAAAAAGGSVGLAILALVALALGAAFLMMGYGVYLAATGIAEIAKAGLEGMVAIYGLAAGMFLLVGAAFALAFAGPMALFGLGLMAIGFGLLAIALFFIDTEDLEAIGLIFTGFKNLGTAAANIAEVTLALGSFLTTAEDLGEEAENIAGALASISLSFWSLGLAMLFMDMEKFGKISTLFVAMSKMSANNAALRETASAIGDIASAIDKMPVFGSIALSWLLEDLKDFGEVGASIAVPMKATSDFVQTVQKVEEKHVENATKLIDQVVRYADVVEGGTFAAAATNFLTQLMKVLGGSEEKKKGEKGQDIYLVMDDAGRKVIASAVQVQLNKKHNIYVNNS
jgi:hypothetical protein